MVSIADAPTDPVLWRAGHACRTTYDQDVAASRALVTQERGPCYVAHSTYGIRDFAVGMPDRWPSPAPAGFEDIGNQLNLSLAQLDRSCDPLDSGPLIRLVLQSSAGTLFEFAKIPGQSFFGLAFGGAGASRDADRLMTRLAEESVGRLGGPSLDWGGFRPPGTTGELWVPREDAEPPEGTATTRSDVAVPGQVSGLCWSALSRDNLHGIAICRQDQVIWSADLFARPELDPFFERVTRSFRRRAYTRLGHDIRLQFPRFRRLLEVTGSAQVTRLVLDVARGAMYVLPLGNDDYLVGVTLIQSQVDRADRKLGMLQSRLLDKWPDAQRPPTA